MAEPYTLRIHPGPVQVGEEKAGVGDGGYEGVPAQRYFAKIVQ